MLPLDFFLSNNFQPILSKKTKTIFITSVFTVKMGLSRIFYIMVSNRKRAKQNDCAFLLNVDQTSISVSKMSN